MWMTISRNKYVPPPDGWSVEAFVNPPRQVFKGKLLLWLAYQSVGVIYGDIGTSPLYVYSSTFTGPPSREDLIGVVSIIIWSLFMMVTVKYVLVILRADNDGEGGTFSTYSLLSRYVGQTPCTTPIHKG
jgi:KUP system potassium uptake protein